MKIPTFLPTGAIAITLWLACQSGTERRDVRSPTAHPKPEPARTGDDQILGADNVSPSDKLEQGPRVSNRGVEPAGGWSVDNKGLHREREVSSPAHRRQGADAGTRK